MSNSKQAVDPVRMAELHLAEFFNVQVPPTIPRHIRQRLFTIAARANAEKVFKDPEIATLLTQIGAIVPKKIGEEIECKGILWEKDHRICSMCGIRDACRATVMNMDLHTIKLSPRLLGRNAVRTKFIINKHDEADGRELRVVAKSERDEEILEYMNEYFRALLREGDIFYQIPEIRSMIRGNSSPVLYQFCVGKPDKLMELRFCSPSPGLKKKLRCKSKNSGARAATWVLHDEATTEEAVALINQHVAEIVREL